jgi:hypothetical protein
MIGGWPLRRNADEVSGSGIKRLSGSRPAKLQGGRPESCERFSSAGRTGGGHAAACIRWIKRCLYPHQSFQSDEERRFAVLIDSVNEPDVLRWVKPGSKQFQIEYRRTERYEPDFVVETKTEKLIAEIKAKKDLEDVTVKAKTKAARTWAGHANAHAKTYGGKLWRYVLIPHDAMLANATLADWWQSLRSRKSSKSWSRRDHAASDSSDRRWGGLVHSRSLGLSFERAPLQAPT